MRIYTKEKIATLLVAAKQLPARDDILLASKGLLLIALQHCSISIAEWLMQYCTDAPLPEEMLSLREPCDGDLVHILEYSIVMAENAGWNGARGDFFQKSRSDAARIFTGHSSASLQTILQIAIGCGSIAAAEFATMSIT
jgi:hypothetical protein